MNLPITSRIKRSPLLQTKNEIATGSKTTKGKDKEEIIEVPGTPGTENLDKLNEGKIDLGADFKPTQAQTDAANAEVAKAKKADEDAAKPTKKKVTVKGEDKTVDVNLKRKQYQDVMEGPWEQRRILRQGRMVGRQKIDISVS